jgi:hypothetical protein
MVYRWTSFLLLVLLVLGFAPAATPAAARPAASEPLCFPQTGECIAGPIRTYWERNGGLPVFGYPITPLRIETVESGWNGPVQWFERDRLEDHGPRGVLAGRLGARLLELQGRPWETFARVSPAQVPPACLYFEATGHSLCEPFLSAWRTNGGIERFGYPITEPMIETLGDWTGTVQYFERRRMELHTEIVGIPVLLGLLGSEVLNGTPALPGTPGTPGTPGEPPAPGPTPQCVEERLPRVSRDRTLLRDAYEQVTFRAVMGCPIAYLENRPAAVQRLERGQMLWVEMGYGLTGAAASLAGQRFIYTVANPGPLYYRFVDTWVAGIDPMRYHLDAPRNGLYVPWGGFGKLWINNSNVREGMGWAVEPEANEGEADIVIFDNIYNDPNNLGALILFEDTGTVYAFGRLDQPEEVQVLTP